jgi:hypothetical protein
MMIRALAGTALFLGAVVLVVPVVYFVRHASILPTVAWIPWLSRRLSHLVHARPFTEEELCAPESRAHARTGEAT